MEHYQTNLFMIGCMVQVELFGNQKCAQIAVNLIGPCELERYEMFQK